MNHTLSAAAVAAMIIGGAVFASSATSAAAAPGPNAIPKNNVVRSVDSAVAGVEEAGYKKRRFRRHSRRIGPRIALGFSFGAPLAYGYPYVYSRYAYPARRCVIRYERVRWHRKWHYEPVKVCRVWY